MFSSRLQRLLALLRRHRLKTVAAVLLLCLLGFGAYPAGSYWYAEYHRRAAERAIERYEFDEAQEHLAACLRVRPRSAPLHFQMARAARRAGRYELAALHLETCQQLEGITPENALERTLLRTVAGEVADTEDLLQGQVERGAAETPQILEA